MNESSPPGKETEKKNIKRIFDIKQGSLKQRVSIVIMAKIQ